MMAGPPALETITTPPCSGGVGCFENAVEISKKLLHGVYSNYARLNEKGIIDFHQGPMSAPVGDGPLPLQEFDPL